MQAFNTLRALGVGHATAMGLPYPPLSGSAPLCSVVLPSLCALASSSAPERGAESGSPGGWDDDQSGPCMALETLSALSQSLPDQHVLTVVMGHVGAAAASGDAAKVSAHPLLANQLPLLASTWANVSSPADPSLSPAWAGKLPRHRWRGHLLTNPRDLHLHGCGQRGGALARNYLGWLGEVVALGARRQVDAWFLLYWRLQVTGALRVLGAVVEGLSEALLPKLPELLLLLRSALTSGDLELRRAATATVAEMAEHLQPELAEQHLDQVQEGWGRP